MRIKPIKFVFGITSTLFGLYIISQNWDVLKDTWELLPESSTVAVERLLQEILMIYLGIHFTRSGLFKGQEKERPD